MSAGRALHGVEVQGTGCPLWELLDLAAAGPSAGFSQAGSRAWLIGGLGEALGTYASAMSKQSRGGGRPGGFPGAGGGAQPNMQALMRQAQKMQQDMAAAQEELAQAQVEGSAPNGLVVATVSGTGEVLALSVKPEVVDPDDIDTLTDLVVVAVRDAQAKAAALQETTMGPLTAGLGGGFPF